MTDKKFDGFKKTNFDIEVEEQIESHCKKFNISPLDAVKLFPVLARRQWLKRYLAHYQLFLKTLNVPGDIAELGVFRGLGLFTWANFLEAHNIGNRTKVVYGFDSWSGFTEISDLDGENEDQSFKEVGGFSPKNFYDETLDAIKIFDLDRFVGWKDRIKLIEGDIVSTTSDFVKKDPGIRFSLIHFDCDLYKPTLAALESFWPKLSRGGIMLFDEYAIKQWPGETQAVDDFFKNKPHIKIQTLDWNNVPAGYIVKEED